MKGYAYSGEKVPKLVPVCVFEGWLDSGRIHDNLYRSPIWKQIGWLIGYWCGSLME